MAETTSESHESDCPSSSNEDIDKAVAGIWHQLPHSLHAQLAATIHESLASPVLDLPPDDDATIEAVSNSWTRLALSSELDAYSLAYLSVVVSSFDPKLCLNQSVAHTFVENTIKQMGTAIALGPPDSDDSSDTLDIDSKYMLDSILTGDQLFRLCTYISLLPAVVPFLAQPDIANLWDAFYLLLRNHSTSFDDPWLEGIIDAMFSLLATHDPAVNALSFRLLPKLVLMTCEAALLDVDIDINSLKVVFYLTSVFSSPKYTDICTKDLLAPEELTILLRSPQKDLTELIIWCTSSLLSGVWRLEGGSRRFTGLLKAANRALKDVKTHNKHTLTLINTIRDTKTSSYEKVVKLEEIFIGHQFVAPYPSVGWQNVWWIASATNQTSVLVFISSLLEKATEPPAQASLSDASADLPADEPTRLAIAHLERCAFRNFVFVDIKSKFSALHIACARGSEDVVKYLLDQRVDPSIAGQRKATPIHVAAQRGFIGIVRLLLDRKAAVDSRTSTGVEPIHLASHQGHESIVELLIQRGALIEARTGRQRTPLHLAARNGHVSVARLLLDLGAVIDARDRQSWTSLHKACNKGHVDVASLLVDRGASLTARDGDGWSPLHFCCAKGHYAVAQMLTSKNAPVDAVDNRAWQPIHLAAESGAVEIVHLLLDLKVLIDVRTALQLTPLIIASRTGRENVCKALIDRGADVNAHDNIEVSPLVASAQHGHWNIAALLIEAGAHVNSKSTKARAALHYASKDGNVFITEMLLDRGADIDVRTAKHSTPLHIAAQYGSLPIVSLLLARGASINATQKFDWTALHHACASGHVGVASLLVSKGASVDAKKRGGVSSFHLAAAEGSVEMLELLHENGAKLSVDIHGDSALHVACAPHHLEAVEYLLSIGSDINLENKKGATPLAVCVTSGSSASASARPVHDVAALLIKHGAKVNAVDQQSMSVLHRACESFNHAVVKLLIDNNAIVDCMDKYGNTPLHSAVRCRNLAIVQTLLDAGATVVRSTPILGALSVFLTSMILQKPNSHGDAPIDYVQDMTQLLQLAQTPIAKLADRIAPIKPFPVSWGQLSQLLKFTEFTQDWNFSKQTTKSTKAAHPAALVMLAQMPASAPGSPGKLPSSAVTPMVASLDLVTPPEMTEAQFFDQLHQSFLITSFKGPPLRLPLKTQAYLTRNALISASPVNALARQLLSLYELKSIPPDVFFHIGETAVALHRPILAARCRMLLDAQFQTTLAALTSVTPEGVRSFCRYIYSGELPSLEHPLFPETVDFNGLGSIDIVKLLVDCYKLGQICSWPELCSSVVNACRLRFSEFKPPESVLCAAYFYSLRTPPPPHAPFSSASTSTSTSSSTAMSGSSDSALALSTDEAPHASADHYPVELEATLLTSLYSSKQKIIEGLENPDKLLSAPPLAARVAKVFPQSQLRPEFFTFLLDQLLNLEAPTVPPEASLAGSAPSGRKKLSEDMQVLFNEVIAAEDSSAQSLSTVDFSLEQMDGAGLPTENFKCHRCILGARWPWFSRMISSGLRESKQGILRLRPENEETGLSSSALKGLLRYLYTGELDWLKSPADCEQIINVFDYFGFGDNEEQKAVHHHLIAHCYEVLNPPPPPSEVVPPPVASIEVSSVQENLGQDATTAISTASDKEDLEATE